MPRSQQGKRKPSSSIVPPLNVQERIDELLKIQLTTFPEKGVLDVGEIERWHRDLEPFPIQGIEWAFENWRKSGRFFPRPGDILDQCIAWEPAEGSQRTRIPAKEFGRGYGELDMIWLAKRVMHKLTTEKRKRLSDEELEALFDDLDKWRGSSPDWRLQRGIGA
jgi:hypothetical protein